MRHNNTNKLFIVVMLLIVAAGAITFSQEAPPRPDPETVRAEHDKLLVKYGLKLPPEQELPEQYKWFQKIFAFIAGFIRDYAPLFLLVVAVIFVGLLFIMFKDVPGQFFPGRSKKTPEKNGEPVTLMAMTAPALYREALMRAREGDFEQALSLLHKASIRKLVTMGLVPPADHLTNKEIRRHITGNQRFYRSFHQLATQSELATFKHRAVDSGSFNRMKSLYDGSFGKEP